MADRTLIRVAQVALVLNALLATVAATRFAFGFEPHAINEAAIMARRAAAGEFAGALAFLVVARRVGHDPTLLVLPALIVASQLADSAFEFVARNEVRDVAPLIAEATFLFIYVVTLALRASMAAFAAPAS